MLEPDNSSPIPERALLLIIQIDDGLVTISSESSTLARWCSGDNEQHPEFFLNGSQWQIDIALNPKGSVHTVSVLCDGAVMRELHHAGSGTFETLDLRKLEHASMPNFRLLD